MKQFFSNLFSKLLPLLLILISIKSFSQTAVNMPANGQTNVTAMCGVVYDPGGENGNYTSGANGYVKLDIPAGVKLTIYSVDIDGDCVNGWNDYLKIYNGPNTTYPLLATIANGCVPTLPYTVTSTGAMILHFYSYNSGAGFVASWTTGNPPAAGTISGPNSVCLNSAATLSVSGYTSGSTLQWESSSFPTSGFFPIAGATSANYTTDPLSAPKYYRVKVTKNCQVSATAAKHVTIISGSNPTTSVSPSAPSICSGSNVTLTASGANTYSWSPSTGLSSTSIANPIASPTTNTTYTVTGTNSNGCTKTATASVTVGSGGSISITPSSASICSGDNVQLLASGFTTYSWSPTTGLSASNIANPIASPMTTTTYTVTGTSSGGCTQTASILVTVNQLGVAGTASIIYHSTIVPVDTLSLVLTGSMGSIQWQSSSSEFGTFVDILGATNDTFSTVLTTGSNKFYRAMTIYGACSAVASNTIEVVTLWFDQYAGCITGNCPPPVSPCELVCNGSFENGIPPNYHSQMKKACGWGAATNSTPDYYHASSPYPVNVPNTNMGSEFAHTGNAMAGFYANAIPWLATSGNLKEYIYQTLKNPLVAGLSYEVSFWVKLAPSPLPPNPPTQNTSQGIAAVLTTYNDIFNFNNTSPNTSGTFPINNNPVITTPVTDPNNWVYVSRQFVAVGGEDVIIIGDFISNSTTPGGGGDYSYYFLDDVSLTPAPITATASPPSFYCGSNTTLDIVPSIIPANNPTNFITWSPNLGTLGCSTCSQTSATPSTNTTYTVSVTYAPGCTYTASTSVTYIPGLPVQASGGTSICAGQQANLSASGAVTYSWSPPTGLSNPNISNPIATPTVTTTYTVTGYDRGCMGTATVTIIVDQPLSITVSPNTFFCIGGSAQLTASGATSYSWSPSTGLSNPNIFNPVATPTATTTYTVTGTGGPGTCPGTATVTVSLSSPPAPIIIGNTSVCDPLIGITGSTYTITNYTGNLSSYNILVQNGTIQSTINSNGEFVILWNNNNQYSSITVTYTDPQTGCQTVTVFGVHPCCVSITSGNTLYDNNNALNNIIPTLGANPTNQCFSFNGRFDVNTNLTLNNCIVKLGGNAVINIIAPFTLTIENNTEFTACDYMWDKIQIQPGAHLIVKGNSLLEDAKVAVYSIGGGDYQLENSRLNRNYKDIILTSYPGTHIGTIKGMSFTCLSSTIRDCSSGTVSQPLTTLNMPYSGYRTQVGIEINGVQDVTIGSLTTGTTNSFSNMNTGILANQSSVYVYNNTFTNINTGTAPNIGIAAIKTTNSTAGIASIPHALYVGNGTTAGQNIFTNCFDGIIADNRMNATINQNSFSNISNRGIYVANNNNLTAATVLITNNTFNTSFTGIHCYRNTKCNTTISYNTMDNMPINNFNSTTGILMQEVFNTNANAKYTVVNNTLKTIQFGIVGDNLNKALIDNNIIEIKNSVLFSQPKGVTIRGNVNSSVTFNNIKCVPASTNNNSNGGIYAAMSTGSFISCNALSDMGYSIRCEGAMPSRVLNNTMSNCRRGIWLNNAGLIGPQGSATTPSNNVWNLTFVDQTYTSGNGLLFTNGINSPLYVQTPNIPTLNNNAGGSNQSMITLPSSGVAQVCVRPKSPIDVLEQIVQDQITFTDAANQWLSKQAVYSEILDDDSLLLASTILTDFRDSVVTAAMGVLDDTKIKLSNDSLINNSVVFTDALNNNAAVVPTINTEVDSKIINCILFESMQNGTEEFTELQLNTLRTIAQKCPFEYGYAVYEARVLLQPYDTLNYENICETDGENRAFIGINSTNENKHLYTLFPNPNNGSMTLNYEIGASDKATIIIYDLMGRVKHAYNLASENTSLSITQNDLQNGVYVYSILVNNQIVQTDRIVIIK